MVKMSALAEMWNNIPGAHREGQSGRRTLWDYDIPGFAGDHWLSPIVESPSLAFSPGILQGLGNIASALSVSFELDAESASDQGLAVEYDYGSPYVMPRPYMYEVELSGMEVDGGVYDTAGFAEVGGYTDSVGDGGPVGGFDAGTTE